MLCHVVGNNVWIDTAWIYFDCVLVDYLDLSSDLVENFHHITDVADGAGEIFDDTNVLRKNRSGDNRKSGIFCSADFNFALERSAAVDYEFLQGFPSFHCIIIYQKKLNFQRLQYYIIKNTFWKDQNQKNMREISTFFELFLLFWIKTIRWAYLVCQKSGYIYAVKIKQKKGKTPKNPQYFLDNLTIAFLPKTRFVFFAESGSAKLHKGK